MEIADDTGDCAQDVECQWQGAKVFLGFHTFMAFSSRKRRVTFEVFPDELLCKILATLPFCSMLQIRSVCKKWNSFLKDRLFQNLWASIHGGEHFLFYHEFLKRVWVITKHYNVTVSAGFLLLSLGKKGYVVDPATSYLKKIPRIPCELSITRHTWNYVDMVVTPGTRNYSIFVTAHKNTKRMTLSRICQYDSTNNAWRLAQFPSGSVGVDRSLQGVVMHEGSLYFLIEFREERPGVMNRYTHRDYFGVARYDKRNCGWEYLTGGFPTIEPIRESPPLLFEHGAKLFLAALFLDRYCIWQYDDEIAEWILFDRFPHDFTRSIQSSLFKLGLCAQCCGDLLYVTKWTPPEYVVPSVMTYNLVDRQCKEMTSDEKERKLVRFWSTPKYLYHPVHERSNHGT